ncbi:hypothetical protein [Streptomyces sp. NPDC003023]|uniref:hypothetical protein n=1 Tax=Streptomyces sp. NPDC003023 TaxID=3364675 RepID=UPI0036C2B726
MPPALRLPEASGTPAAQRYDTNRTKRLVLAKYDHMAAAGLTLENPLTEGESGTSRSTLTPPPARAPPRLTLLSAWPHLVATLRASPTAQPRNERQWYV